MQHETVIKILIYSNLQTYIKAVEYLYANLFYVLCRRALGGGPTV